jgi:histidinol-phosphatase (PHP family)
MTALPQNLRRDLHAHTSFCDGTRPPEEMLKAAYEKGFADYDYVIGSNHLILKDGEYLSVDDTEALQRDDVKKHYGGDYYAYVRDYYANMAGLCEKTKPDIIGHFDLVTKFNEGGCLFNEDDRRYRHAALDAMTAILKHVSLFEINTGAMYRLGRSVPYPSPFLLGELYRRGGEVIITGDSHDAVSIGFRFAEAAELAKSIGFKAVKKLTPEGFIDVAL